MSAVYNVLYVVTGQLMRLMSLYMYYIYSEQHILLLLLLLLCAHDVTTRIISGNVNGIPHLTAKLMVHTQNLPVRFNLRYLQTLLRTLGSGC